MRPSLRQLEYLVTLSEKLNFRLCAQALNVTQPTLSGQIKELEEKLGIVLFERNNRSVKLTPIGKRLAQKARAILHDVDYFCDTARVAGKSLGGIIHLGVLPSIGPYTLPYIIPVLHAKYPELQLHITEVPSRELEIGLDQGKYDLLLTITPVLMDELVSITLFEEPLLVGISHENKVAKVKEMTVEQLENQKVITLGTGNKLFEQTQKIARNYNCKIMTGYEGTSFDAVRHMVSMNMGISFFPALYTYSEIMDNQQISVRPFKDKNIKRSIGLAWRRTSPRIKDYHIIAKVIKDVIKNKFSQITIT